MQLLRQERIRRGVRASLLRRLAFGKSARNSCVVARAAVFPNVALIRGATLKVAIVPPFVVVEGLHGLCMFRPAADECCRPPSLRGPVIEVPSYLNDLNPNEALSR